MKLVTKTKGIWIYLQYLKKVTSFSDTLYFTSQVWTIIGNSDF